MPQMSPMWWTLLMLMFIFTLLMTMKVLYFNYMKMIKMKKSVKKNYFNWSW
uniref:ATP synthase F0 subunit 8 n=1 Tax=Yangisunda tiani TaxID=2873912 RepID=A0A9E7BYJ2_9HEMI|nr:ATP synthase F0 subunit 8 [Yangisunda tiani]UGN61449.1 ATP synthase F0 subunit 8 [Yangisunda tiani]